MEKKESSAGQTAPKTRKEVEVIQPGAEIISYKSVSSVTGEGDILFNVKEGLVFAQALAEFIKEQKLTVKIRGHDYVKVEGWQFAGINFGVVPIVEKLTRLEESGADQHKYQCEVKLVRLANNQTVGFGIGVCTTKEATKRTFDEYAIASMAQTRAIGKAYRNLFAWLVKAAGFEPTPAEEMDEVVGKATAAKIVKNQDRTKREERRQKAKDDFTEDDPASATSDDATADGTPQEETAEVKDAKATEENVPDKKPKETKAKKTKPAKVERQTTAPKADDDFELVLED